MEKAHLLAMYNHLCVLCFSFLAADWQYYASGSDGRIPNI